MTRKDYVLIAEVLKRARDIAQEDHRANRGNQIALVDAIVADFEDELKNDNAGFKRDVFRAATGGVK